RDHGALAGPARPYGLRPSGVVGGLARRLATALELARRFRLQAGRPPYRAVVADRRRQGRRTGKLVLRYGVRYGLLTDGKRLLECTHQPSEGLDELLDALRLQPVRDVLEANPQRSQPLDDPLGLGETLGDPGRRISVVAVGVERLEWHGVDGLGTDERLHVLGVRVARVLGAGRGPQQPLHPGAGYGKWAPAFVGVRETPREDLVRDLGVRDGGLSAEGPR